MRASGRASDGIVDGDAIDMGIDIIGIVVIIVGSRSTAAGAMVALRTAAAAVILLLQPVGRDPSVVKRQQPRRHASVNARTVA